MTDEKREKCSEAITALINSIKDNSSSKEEFDKILDGALKKFTETVKDDAPETSQTADAMLATPKETVPVIQKYDDLPDGAKNILNVIRKFYKTCDDVLLDLYNSIAQGKYNDAFEIISTILGIKYIRNVKAEGQDEMCYVLYLEEDSPMEEFSGSICDGLTTLLQYGKDAHELSVSVKDNTILVTINTGKPKRQSVQVSTVYLWRNDPTPLSIEDHFFNSAMRNFFGPWF